MNISERIQEIYTLVFEAHEEIHTNEFDMGQPVKNPTKEELELCWEGLISALFSMDDLLAEMGIETPKCEQKERNK